MNSSITLVFAAACAAASAAAHALPLTDRASIELFAGANTAMPGDFRGQTVPFELSNGAGSITYNHLDFSDAYRERMTGGGEFDYAVDSHLSAFGRLGFSQFDGATERVGRFETPLTMISDVKAKFGDTSTRELDVGARYMFGESDTLRPFVGAALGATRMEGLHAVVDSFGGLSATKVEIGRPDTVFSQRLETGLQYSPTRSFDLRLTAAANHLDGAAASHDLNLETVGLENPHGDVRGHWDYPAELGGVWHF
jgi:hypothetical protein